MRGIEPENAHGGGDNRYECLGCGRRVERATTPVECPDCGTAVRNLHRPFGE